MRGFFCQWAGTVSSSFIFTNQVYNESVIKRFSLLRRALHGGMAHEKRRHLYRSGIVGLFQKKVGICKINMSQWYLGFFCLPLLLVRQFAEK